MTLALVSVASPVPSDEHRPKLKKRFIGAIMGAGTAALNAIRGIGAASRTAGAVGQAGRLGSLSSKFSNLASKLRLGPKPAAAPVQAAGETVEKAGKFSKVMTGLSVASLPLSFAPLLMKPKTPGAPAAGGVPGAPGAGGMSTAAKVGIGAGLVGAGVVGGGIAAASMNGFPDAAAGQQFDPVTGQPIAAAPSMPGQPLFDPATGMYFDPATGMPLDPTTGMPVTQTGFADPRMMMPQQFPQGQPIPAQQFGS